MNLLGGRKTLQEYRIFEYSSEYRMESGDDAYHWVSRNTRSEISMESVTSSTDYSRAQERHQRANQDTSQQQPAGEVRMDECDGSDDRLLQGVKEEEHKSRANGADDKENDDLNKVSKAPNEPIEDVPLDSHLYNNETRQQQRSVDAIKDGFSTSDGSQISTKDDVEEEIRCERYDVRTTTDDPSDILNDDNEGEPTSNGLLNLHCSAASTSNQQSVADDGASGALFKLNEPYSVYSTTEAKRSSPKYCTSFDASVTTQWDGLAKDGDEGSPSGYLVVNGPNCYSANECKNYQSDMKRIERKNTDFIPLDQNDTQLEQSTIDEISKGFFDKFSSGACTSVKVSDLSTKNNDENDSAHLVTQLCNRCDVSKKLTNKNIGKGGYIYHTVSEFDSSFSDGSDGMSLVSVYEMVQFFESLSRSERPGVVGNKVLESVPNNRRVDLTPGKDIDGNVSFGTCYFSNPSSIPNSPELSCFKVCSQTRKRISNDTNESGSIDGSCPRMDLEVSHVGNSNEVDLDEKVFCDSNESDGFGSEINLFPDSCRKESESWQAQHKEDDSEISQLSSSREMISNYSIIPERKEDSRTGDETFKDDPSTENSITLAEEDVEGMVSLEGKAENVTDLLYIAFVVLTFCRMSSGKKRVESASLTDVAASSDDTACYNFTTGNPLKREFYSPNYPNHYPKNTQCTLRITADVGHMVMLDFRDLFHLESSGTCEYDRLEVRDGAYGYSPLLGQFCGTEFPSKIYSSKRYMWLQFSSDESIEYEGFRAVYDYVPIPNQGQNGPDNEKECSYHKTGSSGIIRKSEIGHLWHKYRQDDTIECMWTIETDAGKKLYINFKKYNLDRPNDCDQNFIQLFKDGLTPDKHLAKFCGTTAEPQKTDNNITHVRLFTHRDAFNNTDFIIHFTSFREIKKDEQCDLKTEFNCGDQTCIDILLKCDGEYDCKYRYDEEPTLCARALGAGMVLTSEHMIIILVVFFSLVVAMCASISISCYNKIKERRLREREYRERRSKEASVEATLSASVPPPARQRLAERMADDESSDGGCYVPEVDLSVFSDGKQQRPNGGDTIPKKTRGGSQQQQHYPYISESFESLASDVIVPPAPPPVPAHLRGPRRDPSPPPPTYRIVGGKVVANPAKNEPNLDASRTSTLDRAPGFARPVPRTEPIDDPKSSWLRGPLEAGAPSRTALGPSKYGMSSRVTPDAGARGPLAALKDRTGPSAFGPRVPYMGTPVGDASDSSRAHSVASTLSAPDALLGKR